MINSFRSTCEIGFEDKIVITGGVDKSDNIVARVTSFTFNQGFLADLPELNEARLLHGCTHFLNNDNKQRLYNWIRP